MNRLFTSFGFGLALLTAGIITTNTANAQFTTGNVVVLQAGTGSAALAGVATPVVLKEYNTTTLNQLAPVQTIYVDTTGVARLTISGSATSEGQMTLSSDSTKLVIAGYDAAINTAGIATSAATSYARVIDTIGYVAVVGRADTTQSAFTGGNIRSAARSNTNNYWSTGNNTGVYYSGDLVTPDTIQKTLGNTRVIIASNGKLYYSAQSGTPRIYKYNSYVTSRTTPDTLLNNLGTGASPYGFAVNSGETIAYVADDRTSTGGGIQKWTRSGSIWSLAYTLSTGSSSGARSVVVDWSGANPVLYATTNSSSTTTLIRITDSNATAPPQTLATAPSNTAYRSVAFAPKQASCIPPSALVTPNGTINFCQGDAVVLKTNSTPGLTYTWKRNGVPMTGPGAADSIIKLSSGGHYQVVVTNAAGCKDSSAVVVINQNPRPVTSINSAFPDSVCAGDTIRITAAPGVGNMYRWVVGTQSNPSTTDSSFSFVSPLSSSDSLYQFYVVITTTNGCVDSSNIIGIQVVANPSPAIVYNAGILSTGGYSSYQWFESGIAIAGATSMTYTPIADGAYSVLVTNATGCSAMSAITNVTGVGITTILSQQGIRIYPNPASDRLVVEAPIPVSVVIKDLQGKIIIKTTSVASISIEKLAVGAYSASIYNAVGLLLGSQLIVKSAY